MNGSERLPCIILLMGQSPERNSGSALLCPQIGGQEGPLMAVPPGSQEMGEEQFPRETLRCY